MFDALAAAAATPALWVALAILCFAYFVRGLTGFGSGLIAVPALAQFYPLQTVVPVVMSLDFAASLLLGGVGGRQTDWREVGTLLPFGMLGAVAGSYMLLNLPAAPMLAALGVFTLIFGVRNLMGIEPKGAISRWWAIPTGLVGSSAGALFGTSGPPYIIYLTHRLADKAAVRATFSWLFVMDGGVRLTLFFAAGLFLPATTRVLLAAGVLPMLGGLYVGNRTHVGIERATLLRAVGGLLVGSALALLIKALRTGA